MIPIGFGLAWAGYAVIMWGYCLVKDYNVTFADLFKATWPGSGGGTGPGPVTSQVVPSPSGQPSGPQSLTGQ